MSNERRHPDDPTDPVVSNAYRELSNERTPEHLDHVVLNEARNAAKRRHVTAMAWFRPAAWVVTIGLCLAIVLEVADLPLQEQGIFDEPAKNEEPDPAPTDAEDTVASPPVEAKSMMMQEAERAGMARQPALPTTREPGRVSPDDAPDRALPAEEPPRRELRESAPAAIEVDALKDADMSFLRDAEDRARLQAGSDEEAEEIAVQGLSVSGVASEVAAERYCDAAQTGDPNTWLECILDLENRGMPEAARLERELLREAFPDAYVPADMNR